MTLPTTGAGPSALAAAFAGFLDAVSNVEHVYLLFRGLSSYDAANPLIRLRRDSDDAELDFGVDSGGEFLDTAAITTWLGGATGYVVTMYDQAIAGDDITQATGTSQPALTLSDAFINNQPSMIFDGTDNLTGSLVGGDIPQPTTIYTQTDLNSGPVGDGGTYIPWGGANPTMIGTYKRTGSSWAIFAGSLLAAGTANTNPHIHTSVFNGVSSEFWVDGTSVTSGDAGANALGSDIAIGSDGAGGGKWEGRITSLIIVDGNSSDTDKNTINTKLGTVYGISVVAI